MTKMIDPFRRTFLQQASRLGAGVAMAGMIGQTAQSSAEESKSDGTFVTNFAQSYLRWTLDTKLKPPKTVSKPLPMTLNRVRMPIEATASLKHVATGAKFLYALGAECRTEQVWVKRDIWHDPNASMCMIGGERHCLIEKHWARADFETTLYPPKLGAQPERHLIDPREAFASFSIDLAPAQAVELTSTEAMMEALSGPATLVSRTEYTACGYEIRLEYPVKTANFSERERYYQVDTGPILFPGIHEIGDPDSPPLLACRLAFAAHNAPEWAEFIVCVPTIVKDDLKVHHYSHIVRVEGTRNQMFCLT
jgi:hypothetical protein